MIKLLIGVVVVIVLVISGFYVFSGNAESIEESGLILKEEVKESIEENIAEPKLVTFVVTGEHLRFYIDGVENPDMKVKLGDKVRVEYTGIEGFHDWKIDEFNAATKQVQPGIMTSVEFVADKKGTFEYYCSVGQHRANGMFGKFIVE